MQALLGSWVEKLMWLEVALTAGTSQSAEGLSRTAARQKEMASPPVVHPRPSIAGMSSR
jgi:hypothetical protein